MSHDSGNSIYFFSVSYGHYANKWRSSISSRELTCQSLLQIFGAELSRIKRHLTCTFCLKLLPDEAETAMRVEAVKLRSKAMIQTSPEGSKSCWASPEAPIQERKVWCFFNGLTAIAKLLLRLFNWNQEIERKQKLCSPTVSSERKFIFEILYFFFELGFLNHFIIIFKHKMWKKSCFVCRGGILLMKSWVKGLKSSITAEFIEAKNYECGRNQSTSSLDRGDKKV